MNITPSTRVRLVPNQSSSVMGEETVLLNYDLGNYYELNEVGGFIWALLKEKGELSVQEIQAQMLDEFDVEPAVCQQELQAFLTNLWQEKLIHVAD